MHTSTPSFAADVKVAQALKDTNPRLKIGLVGAKVAVEPEPSLTASSAIDFVAREEFDFTIKEVAEAAISPTSTGSAIATGNGVVVHNRARAVLEEMDRLPFVTEVYKRDLKVEDYFIGYLKHPYLSLYTGRGCRSKMHLLPVAADRRRQSLPRPQRRACHRGDPAGAALFPAGQGILL